MKKILLLLLFPASLFGQGLYVPAKTILGTVNGYTRPIAGATITVCAASTGGIPCAPALANTVFQDAGLTIPLSNPLFTDSNGNYPQFAVAPGSYTITESAAGYAGFSYQVQTSCVPGGACSLGSLTVVGTATVGALVATGNVSAGGTLGAQSVNGVVNAGSYATFALALAACPNPGTLSISSAISVSANASVPSTCTLQFAKPGVLNIATATTLTINSAIIAPEDATIFSLTGTGAVSGLTFARPEWFGGQTSAAVNAAYASLASGGGIIKFRVGTYVSPWVFATQITKANVELSGSGQPDYNSQTAPTALAGGTILQGPVFVKSDPAGPANGFYVHDLGIDSGSAVCTALFGGVAQQGVSINNNGGSGSTDGPPFIENVKIVNVTTLGQSTSTGSHSILIDNGDGAIIQNVKTFFNIYGVIAKGQRYTINGVYSRGHGSAGMYVKSDSPFGIAKDTNISNVHLEQAASAGDTAGLLIDSQVTQIAMATKVTNFTARGTSFGIVLSGTNTFTADTVISNFVIDSTTGAGINIGGANSNARVVISNGIINSPVSGDGITVGTSQDVLIDNVMITNVAAGNGITVTGSRAKVSNVQVVSTSGWGVKSSGGSVCVTNLTGSANTSGLLDPTGLVACTDGPKAMTGLMTTYNNIATVSNGIPSEIATIDLTGQTAAQGTTTLYAVPSTGAGQYRLSWNAKVTTAAATSSTLGPLTITYTDPDGVSITTVVGAMILGGSIQVTGPTNNNTLTSLIGVPVMINCKASTNITFSFAYASNAANTMAYNLHMKLEAL